ncbi:hypothetical protein FDH34_gp511 [Serratia phage BF]|uniref:Uncharacterized protein n=2 Tax=Eneladusvirus BF TaxID=2560751 RepID=A0A7L8ZP09_9CAUD|nr:hypothetical protein FDH34_gp511 [Serratia phage BF]AQW88934.1 hypothetical protein BF_0409 [Serratia phage BF]QOI71890.1 hypothetical protein pEaSNUABM47_00411 [Erwinia phage pEa_SNUABM_47]QXO12657.1 hypothetical protein pEaSNUABM49_00416 [Erwinia phage pEa_SNUABM_49]
MGSNVEASINVKLVKQPRGMKGAKPDIEQIHTDLCSIVENETFSIHSNTNIVAEPECRWSEIDSDMKKLSVLYPGILFTVKVVIPDYEVNELHYFYEGKTHEAVITFSPFDEALLK